jgi:hypothetical protein
MLYFLFFHNHIFYHTKVVLLQIKYWRHYEEKETYSVIH